MTPEELATMLFNYQKEIYQLSKNVQDLSDRLQALEESSDPGVLNQAQIIFMQLWDRFITS